MKKRILPVLMLIMLVAVMASCTCSHNWKDASCTEPRTCSICGETEGEALGHTWTDATCTIPKTCTACGATEGEALGHNWADATCTIPKTCTVCGMTEGEALGHTWTDADCISPKTCTVCGATEGEASGHKWADATCTSPKTCTVCGETEGETLEHNWAEATCALPKTCTVCGATEGEALGHNWAAADCTTPETCTVCGETRGEAIGHALKVFPGKDPTCTEPGYCEYEVCGVCGYSTYTELPALGHDITSHKGKAATCFESGYEDYETCNRCDYSTYKALPATGHVFEGYTCKHCGIDYAEYCKVGKKSTAKVSNDNVGYNFYQSQKTTGKYSKNNCGPTCIYMAGKWADPSFNVTAEEIRKIHLNDGGYWTDIDLLTACTKVGLNVSTYSMVSNPTTYNNITILEVMKYIDNGNVLIVLFNTGSITADAENKSVIGRGYGGGGTGHFVLVKGYWIVDGKTYFEIYDPDLPADYKNPILGSDHTRYYDAIQLIHSAVSYDNERVLTVISRKSSPKPKGDAPSAGQLYKQTGNYVYFGSYPQGAVKDPDLSAVLSKLAGPTSTWTSYDYYVEGSVSDFMVYKDVVYEGEKYRGVFYTSYRPYSTTTAAATYWQMDQWDGRFYSNNIYWFKYEPVRWNVIAKSSGDLYLCSEFVIDAQDYNHFKNGSGVSSANNYAESAIRAWLNKTFYDTAFSEAEKSIIKTTHVNNSASSTGQSGNKYACGDTDDKVFLLSYSEATSSSYGFSSVWGRRKSSTEYARSQGTYKNGPDSNWAGDPSTWNLRSPDCESGERNYYVSDEGEIYAGSVTTTTSGVVPAIHIKVS